MKFDLETFHKFDFIGSQITGGNIYAGREKALSNFYFEGSFERKQYESCKFWCLWFKQSDNPSNMNIADFMGNKIKSFDICPEGEIFLVKMIIETENGPKETAFRCEEISPYYYRYKGMSYRNLYCTEDYKKTIDSKRYVLDKKYLLKKEEFVLPDGYSIEAENYQDSNVYLQKCMLKKSGKTVYEYLCTYNHGVRFKDFILHSNGRRYFPFHVDLYGISYLDIDSLEAYHYVPEGYYHDCSYLCGESFIVTDIHYDKNTNLIAYGGCYWAYPYGVMVGDFSDPLNFTPKLYNISKIVDPDGEGYDIDFKKWQDNKLVVSVENDEVNKEKRIPVEEIIKAVRRA